jgi:hypothetical protein
MNPGSSEEPRPKRSNVVAMPPRRQPEKDGERKSSPPGPDRAESHEEPGYGHGV